MAESILTRNILRKRIRKKFPKVTIASRSEAFREAIIRTMEEQLGVERSNLPALEASNFDRHVEDFYCNLPRFWGLVQRNEYCLVKRHGGWLNKVIRLGPDPDEEPVNNLYLFIASKRYSSISGALAFQTFKQSLWNVKLYCAF